MSEIKNFLPQREPFLFVDRIISATKEEIIGEKLFDKTFFFYLKTPNTTNTVPDTFLIEALMQCGGAALTKIGIINMMPWVIAKIDKVNIFSSAYENDLVLLKIKTNKISRRIINQTGIAYVNEKPLLQASWVNVPLIK